MPGPAISRSVSSGKTQSGKPIDPGVLLARFGLTQFRAGQRDVVDAIADGHDVLCVMPTGGGKSLCYQLPSLGRAGTTIVVDVDKETDELVFEEVEAPDQPPVEMVDSQE